ncbi:hypothetical protein M8994_16400 [Brucella sp. 21LCYQ03]|nr:hypothetical protein [Brucella sp. 21LCYQ03]
MQRDGTRLLDEQKVGRARELLMRLIHMDKELKANEIALNRITAENKLRRQDITKSEFDCALEQMVREGIIIELGKQSLLFLLTESGHRSVFQHET